MKLTLQCTREADGRWLAEVSQLPGVLAYGSSEVGALAMAQALALRVLAGQIETGHSTPGDISLSIVRAKHADDTGAEPSFPAGDASGYDAWLAAQVQEALDDATPAVPHDEAMRQIRAAVFAK